MTTTMHHYLAKTPYGEFRKEVPSANYKFCIVYLFENGQGELVSKGLASWTTKKSYIKRVATTNDVINYGAISYKVFDCIVESSSSVADQFVPANSLEAILNENVF